MDTRKSLMVHFWCPVFVPFSFYKTKVLIDVLVFSSFFSSFWRADMEEREEETKPQIDENFWDLLLSADKKDYESICAQYGVTDFRGMLKKLNEKKEEREKEQEKVCACFL